ncbi:MAG: SdpI family protein [Patescibacteria group bacterium]
MTNPIKPTIKTEILPIVLILLAVVVSFYFYSNFPERVPIHWNIAGQPDNWGSRTMAAFLFPGIMIGMYFLFLFLPYMDPKKERYQQFRKVYHVFKGILLFFMVAIYFISSLNALGYNISVELWVPVLVGMLFIILGNYMGKIKPNWFMGIRTPWTLSSEDVWNKTHRFGGKMFILGGVLMSLMYFIPVSLRMWLFGIILAIILLGTVGYSYFLFLKEKRNERPNN